MNNNHSNCFIEKVHKRIAQEGLQQYSLSQEELDRLINIVEEEYNVYMKGRENS
jgi:hypothetical protein